MSPLGPRTASRGMPAHCCPPLKHSSPATIGMFPSRPKQHDCWALKCCILDTYQAGDQQHGCRGRARIRCPCTGEQRCSTLHPGHLQPAQPSTCHLAASSLPCRERHKETIGSWWLVCSQNCLACKCGKQLRHWGGPVQKPARQQLLKSWGTAYQLACKMHA